VTHRILCRRACLHAAAGLSARLSVSSHSCTDKAVSSSHLAVYTAGREIPDHFAFADIILLLMTPGAGLHCDAGRSLFVLKAQECSKRRARMANNHAGQRIKQDLPTPEALILVRLRTATDLTAGSAASSGCRKPCHGLPSSVVQLTISDTSTAGPNTV
jgi:hypothetical protein